MFDESFVTSNPDIVVSMEMLDRIEALFQSASHGSSALPVAVKRRLLSNDRMRRLLQDVLLSGQAVTQLDAASLYRYAVDSERLLRLVDDIASNEALGSVYKQLVSEKASDLVSEMRSTAVVSTGSFDLQASAARIVPVLSLLSGGVSVLSEEDVEFLVFFAHFMYTSLSTMLVSSENQSSVAFYGIDASMMTASIEYSTGVAYTYNDNEFYALLSTLKDVASAVLPAYTQIKNFLFESGIPFSSFTTSVLLYVLGSMRPSLLRVAGYTDAGGEKIFYKTTDHSLSVLFK